MARAIRNANRGDSRESIHRNPCFQNGDSQFLAPRNAIRKRGVQFGNAETIRENQAIRANLRIDSCELGPSAVFCRFLPFCGVSCKILRISALTLQSLLFFRFPCFFCFAIFLDFGFFPFFSKDLEVQREKPCFFFFEVSLAVFFL